MPWYSVNTSILINSLRMGSPTLRQVWFTDDSAGTGRIKALYDLYKYPLSKEWIKYGYHVIGLRKHVIGLQKSQELASEAELGFRDNHSCPCSSYYRAEYAIS